MTAPSAKRQPIPFGRYLLLDRINIGGMAEVWRGKVFGAGGFERLVAIKRILPNIAEDQEFISMFEDEAKISNQLTHANICQIYELNRTGSSLYIAMEYVPGKDLRSIFERARKKGEPPPVPLVCYVIGKLCEGLDYAHRKKDSYGRELNVVHRDVSPQNVLISFEGEVKVIDFGIAKAAGKVTKTQAGILKGKFGYMSPEQIRGLPLDRRSDVFAIGVCLYELLTGERLFVGDSDFQVLEKVRKAEVLPPSTYNRRIPEQLERIVLRALAKDPEDRYQYASELGDELQRFLITSDSIFSRKDLMQYMKSTFAEEVDRERARLAEYAEVKAPEGLPTGAEGQASATPVLARAPALTAVPTPSGTPAVVVRGTALPRLTAAAPQRTAREDDGSTMLVDGEALGRATPLPEAPGPRSVQAIAGEDPVTDPGAAAQPGAPDADDAPVSPTDETIVRLRHAPPPLPPRPRAASAAELPVAATPPAPSAGTTPSTSAQSTVPAASPGPAPSAVRPAVTPPQPAASESAAPSPAPAPAPVANPDEPLRPDFGPAPGPALTGTAPEPSSTPPSSSSGGFPAVLPSSPSGPVPAVPAQAASGAFPAETALASAGGGNGLRWLAAGLVLLAAGGAAAWAFVPRGPATGRVLVDVSPPEAKGRVHLTIAGKPLGIPATWPLVESVPSGTLEVLASAEGFKPALVEVSVPRGGAPVPVVVTLQRTTTAARLVVVSEPDDAEVRLGGAVVKRAGTKGFWVGEVPVGAEQSVQVRRAGYRVFETKVSARSSDEPLEVRTALEPLEAQVLVTTSPAGAVVFSGERLLGVTPVVARVPATTTALTLRKRCFETAQVPVHLPEQPGPRVKVSTALRKVPGCR